MKKYGLIGYPLTHSFSKKFWTEKFENEGSVNSYENFEIDAIEKILQIINKNPELAGLNVTIPYKEQVIPFLDKIDNAAKEVGAINTVKIIREKGGFILEGYNSDTYGFETTLKPLLKKHHTKALILGTGGASKAIKYVLSKLKIGFISASIEELKENEIRYEEITPELLSERFLIINATPLGTYPKVDTYPRIPYEHLTEKHLLYDLVYNPEVTRFMEFGKEKGAMVKNGYDMLIGQALRSYEIWNK
ncbi:MAG: shikimate dehydrogenase [Prolixibacteraceae bacterium]|nr:shikimate dehydrogenase [Prolixibacteraceae bacterium]